MKLFNRLIHGKFLNLLIFGIAIISLHFSSFQVVKQEMNDKELSEYKIEQKTKLNMDKHLLTEKQDSFLHREVNTYLNGEWIGKAISYGCYREGQAPGIKGPTEAEILQDLKIILNYWNLIRVYGSDEDSERIVKIIRENNLPIKVMLGVWLEGETDNLKRKQENLLQVNTAIKLANEYPDIIWGINVGNETQVFWSAHKLQTDKLVEYIRMVRNNTAVSVTTADDYNYWNKPESKSVAEEVDFIVVHIYPLWNGQLLENSIEWMNNIYYNQIREYHQVKTIVLGEIGWATDYDTTKTGNGEQGSLIKGEVSLDAQEKFLIQLSDWVEENKVVTFFFEAFDEPWKGGGENSSPKEIEKHWGVFYENRSPKASFQNYLKNYENTKKKH